MKTPQIALLLCLTAVCATRISAQNFTDLKELKQVKIVVEELDADAERAGIVREALEASALTALRQGLPKIEVTSSAVSYVYVHIITSTKNNWCVVRVVMELWRPVVVLKDDGGPVAATLANVRERGTTLTGPERTMGARVLEDLREKITEMAADYSKANP
jgi:hypothetical protein